MPEPAPASPAADLSNVALSVPDADEWETYLKGSTADSNEEIPDFESLLNPPTEPATSDDLVSAVLSPGFGSRPVKLVLPKDVSKQLAFLNRPDALFDKQILPFLASLRENDTFVKDVELESLPRINREARIALWMIAQSGLAPAMTVAYHRTLLDLAGVGGLKSSSLRPSLLGFGHCS